MKISATISPDAPMDDPILFRGEFSDTIRKAAYAGYDAVELQMSDPAGFDCRQICRLCRENKIAVSSLATGSNCSKFGLSLSASDSEVRQKSVECIRRYIDLAEETGAPVIIGMIRGAAGRHASYAAFEELLIDSLHRCMDYANPRGVQLVIEGINRYEMDNLRSIAEVLDLLDKVGEPGLKLHIDTFHMNIEESRPLKSLMSAAGRIGHVHYVDNNCCWPGNGTIDFCTLTSLLDFLGYEGYYAVECLPLPSEEEAAANAARYLRSLRY